MKERPVIFNGEMVRAILDGRKTQTRRVMKPQPEPCYRGGHWWPSNAFKTMLHIEEQMQNGQSGWKGLAGDACPFGQVGDRLWVRETFAVLGNEDGCPIDWDGNLIKGDEKQAARIYKASCWQEPGNYGLWSIPDRDTQYEGTWRPSIHMPRWASRILLEITAVRVERLKDISESDARAEGVMPTPGAAEQLVGGKLAFAELWASIYGHENWRANPWVWVIEFKQVSAREVERG
nr:MAG TPA: ASCH domain protein [Caudoviricetes sp.]